MNNESVKIDILTGEVIKVDVLPNEIISIDIVEDPPVNIKVREDAPTYDGAYTVTPNNQQQVLQTAGKKLKQNVIVEPIPSTPIPSNYGKIVWDGSALNVI